MQFDQPMSIAYDLSPDSYRAAVGYRAVLEYYTHCVTQVQLDSEEKARSFFGHPPRSALTLLPCHGWGERESEAVLSLEVQRQVNRIEHEAAQLRLTPARLGEVVGPGAGIFLSLACWSGKRTFARAFLAAGYDAFLAPEKTSDVFSAFQFVAAFAGSLLHEVRDWGAYPISTRQAFERARRSDDYWDGAAGFRLFEREGERGAGVLPTGPLGVARAT
jgi:hypothetical protein